MIEIFKRLNNFKKKIKNNDILIGGWMQISSTDIADIFSSNKKYDWVCIDLEHGNIDYGKLGDIFRIIQLNGKIPFARLKSSNENEAQRVLDLGAMGLILPKVESSEDVVKIIESSIHPYHGKRGHAFFRGNIFGKFFNEYNKFFKKPVIIAMIETSKGLESINDILSVKNLDGIFVGPYDLTASLGVTGNLKSKKYLKALKNIIYYTENKKKIVGIHVVDNSKKLLNQNIKKGFKFIAYSMDTVLLNIKE